MSQRISSSPIHPTASATSVAQWLDHRARRITSWRRGSPATKSLNTMREAMPLLDHLLAQDRHAYFFAAPARIGEAIDVVAQHWRVKNLLVWDKGNMGRRGDLVAGYGSNW